ncbi:MAG: hypothetical protein HYY84_10055 [Deltaproteobacteria bacterium]|nr:hypothetical protein [Deltaproteobacteria bacterium]
MPRVLRRVAKRVRRLAGFGRHVPHTRCFAVDRELLRGMVTEAEIRARFEGLSRDVILVPEPGRNGDDKVLVQRAWRDIFHACVHVEFSRLIASGRFSEAVARERIHRIGQTEFDEIRLVLRHEDLVLPADGVLAAYVEFVALFLELAYFAPEAVPRFFPSLGLDDEVHAVVSVDIDPGAVVRASCPAGWEAEAVALGAGAEAGADAVAEAGAGAGESRENDVRTALDAVAAGQSAASALRRLVQRLDAALGEIPCARWIGELGRLAERAALRNARRPGHTVEAHLLFDLQKACVDHERELFSADLVRFVTTFGRAKVVRPLPAAQQIRVARHLQSALKKAARLDLDTASAHSLRSLLHGAIERADRRARESLSPRIHAVLDEVGLTPSNIPETVARQKLVNDLLDVALARGHLTLGNLRDVISRSDLKLPNLAGVRAFFCGDVLLRADARLSGELDGVYRRGEIYLRGLQKLSSLGFGTISGRLLNLYALLPAVAAYIVLEGLQHIVGPIVQKLSGVHLHILTPISFALTASYVFGLIHSKAVRRATVASAKALGTAVKFVFYAGPRFVLTRPVVKRVLDSIVARLVGRYLLKPAVPTLIAIPIGIALDWPLDVMIPVDAALFVLVVAFLSSAPGREFEEIVSDAMRRAGRQLRHHILPSLVRLFIDFFSALVSGIEHLLYVVDEWLRFRAGGRRSLIPLRATLGLIWFFLTYLIRIYINLLIEPQVNPIKHFPVVTVSHKIILPLTPQLIPIFSAPFMPFGSAFANTIGGATVVLLPGVFGFLAWELKENWRLYRANRSPHIKPVMIGSHGETMARLLRPGFHSGTIPKAFIKLRRAATKSGAFAGRGVAKHEEALHHVEESVRQFVEREFIDCLALVGGAAWRSIQVAGIHLGSNRIRIELNAPHLGDGEAVLVFEEQSDWIIASTPEHGFIARLSTTEREILDSVLAVFFRKAAVDYTRERVEAALATSFKSDGKAPPYDFSDDGLVVWPGSGFASEVRYNLRRLGLVAGKLTGPSYGCDPPEIDVASLAIGSLPSAWDDWVRWCAVSSSRT